MVLVNGNRHCSRRREVERLIPIIGIICFIVPFVTSATIGNMKNITADILKYRNTDVNPCDNFYQFACGNAQGNPEVSTNFVSVVDKSMDDLIQKQTSSNFKPFKLIEDLYKTCMNDKAIGQQALDLLKKVIEKLGGWPVLTGVKDSNFDWVDFTVESKRTGLNFDVFLDIEAEIYPYFNEGSMKYFISAVPEVWNNKSSNSLDELSTAYQNYIAKISTLLGNKRDISKEIDEIIEFERKILEVRWCKHSGNGSNEITIEELIKKWPSINWDKLINNVIINNLETPMKISELSLWETPSLPNFIELFEKTPKHVLANYAVWKIIQNTVPYLTEEYRELKREYCLTQTCEDTTRALSCVSVVKQYLGPAVNLLYAKNYIGSEIVNGIENIIVNLKAVLVDLVNDSTWMNQKEKKEDIEIIENTEFIIGFEERDKSDNDFEEYYKNLKIDTNNYFQTLLNLELFNTNKKFNNITSLGLQNAINPMKFNFAFSTFGRIYISMGLFREPIFDPKYPMHVNFGRLAPIIAIELSKIIYNAEHKSSEQLISCFRHQYDNYTNFEEVRQYANNAKVSWRVSFYMGYKIAYLAYQRWVKTNGIEPALPGLPYTNNQLFWIDSLRISCMDTSNWPKVIDGKYNIFEFGYFKAVTSTEHFSDAFECPNNESSFIYNYGKSCTYL